MMVSRQLINFIKTILMKNLKLLLFLSIVYFSTCVSQVNQTMKNIDKTTVKELDINKYLGTWYELARFDHKFERGLQGVTATYSLRSDGKIRVVNQGYRGSLQGEQSTAIGKAKLNTKAGPGKLKVSFFWFFYGDYFVLELDPDYQWALIGSSSDNYLWILSRTPKMETKEFEGILNRAKERGYSLDDLIVVEHK